MYLIAHKVRGEAAFDVAIRCDDMGTDSDPGPWWIIPTSGHRAYPYWFADFDHLRHNSVQISLLVPDLPVGLPDHYSVSHEPAPRKDPKQILASLGLYKPVIINRRL